MAVEAEAIWRRTSRARYFLIFSVTRANSAVAVSRMADRTLSRTPANAYWSAPHGL
jgi:hypothetical protein